MRAEVESDSVIHTRPLLRSEMQRVASSSGRSDGVPAADDDQSEWAKQEQQVRTTTQSCHNPSLSIYRSKKMIIRQQDDTIDTIAGTLNTLQEQAGLMGQEIGEHVECVLTSPARLETIS